MRDLEPGDAIVGWRVMGPLGRGGVADVYEVVHTDGRRGALKRLHAVSAEQRQRLQREAVALTALAHPHIVRLIDYIDTEETLALVLELVQGSSLAELPPPDLATAERWFHGVLEGVAAAHAAGWIHRDLKPSNVLMAEVEGDWVPKVADFGLARVLSPHTRLTSSGVLMGTPAYMSPEQVRDPSSTDARTDVFSLGAILYELVCGRPPFGGADVFAILRQAEQGAYPPPRQLCPGLEERILLAIDGALHPDQDRRIPDCETLAAVLRGERGWARRPSAADVSPTWAVGSTLAQMRRPRWVGGAMIALLAAGVGVAVWGAGEPVVLPPVVSDEPGVQAAFEEGWEHWAQARFSEAEIVLAEVALAEPEAAWPRVAQAFVYGAQSYDERAFDALAAAERLTDEAAVRAMARALQQDPEGTDEEMWTELAHTFRHPVVQLVTCAQLGWGSLAEGACARAGELAELPAVHWARGAAAIDWEAWEVAEHHAREILAHDADHPRGLVLLGRWHLARGEWEEASVLADRVLARAPHDVEAIILSAACMGNLGDLAGALAILDPLLAPDRSLDDQVRAARALAFTELGLGQQTSGRRALAAVAERARARQSWQHLGEIQLREGAIGWFLQDPDRLAGAQEGMTAALVAPELSPTLAQPMRAAQVYMRGLEGALRGEVAWVHEARRRLLSSDLRSVAWTDRDTAVAVLAAYAADLEGDSTALLDIARSVHTCEAAALGGRILVARGHAEVAAERYREAIQECPGSGTGRYLRWLAERGLHELGDSP